VRVLTIALGLSLWIAIGSVVLAVADGLGDDPGRRLVVGLLLAGFIGAGLVGRSVVVRWLRVRPWLVLVVAAGELALTAVDGVVDGPYVQVTLTSIGLASVVARPRTVWLCVLVLDVGYAAAVLAERSPSSLVDDGDLAGVLGAVLGYPFAALVVLALAAVFRRFAATADLRMDALRTGDGVLTRALAEAVGGPGRTGPPLLPRGNAFAALTPRQVRVVEELARGVRAKQIAHAWGVSLSLVRAEISAAKKATGARTLPELAGMTSRPGWPTTETPDGR
jgi:DNA-binding NarL/FixJ family response regulator